MAAIIIGPYVEAIKCVYVGLFVPVTVTGYDHYTNCVSFTGQSEPIHRQAQLTTSRSRWSPEHYLFASFNLARLSDYSVSKQPDAQQIDLELQTTLPIIVVRLTLSYAP